MENTLPFNKIWYIALKGVLHETSNKLKGSFETKFDFTASCNKTNWLQRKKTRGINTSTEQKNKLLQ